MQAEFDILRASDLAHATCHLWVFKKSATPQKYTAYFVRTADDLNAQLKAFFQAEIARITEFTAYTYISQTNENSCLVTTAAGTDFLLLKTLIDRPEPEHPIRGAKDLKNAEGYVAKLTYGGNTIYCVKRSMNTWKTSYPKKYLNLTFVDGELSTQQDDSFSIEKNFDFYCVNNSIFIANKRSFESAMEYRSAYTQAVTSIQADPSFSAMFNDMQPLINYVGTNSTHLRRMATVEQKALYSNPAFLTSLARVNALRGWGLNFDPATNKIIACDITARRIMQVLLDHVLMSEVTNNMYVVPDATRL